MSTMSLSTQLRAASLSRHAHERVRAARAGKVLATYDRSCYLDLDGHIVALVLPELLNGPLNLVVVSDTDFRFTTLPVRETVRSADARIHIGSTVEVMLGDARIWESQLAPWVQRDLPAVRAGLPLVQEILRDEAPEGSFATYLTDPTALSPRARRGLSLLKDAMVRRSPDSAASAAQQLAGLGGGLTPSGDDALVGALLCVSALPQDEAHGVRPAIIGEARGRSTRISEAYLEAAARGDAGEAWHRLVDVLRGHNRPAIVAAARRVMAFGETSGSDMLTGFLLALAAGLRMQ